MQEYCHYTSTLSRPSCSLTVKGIPNLDSFSNVSSGKLTPISLIASDSDENPMERVHVVELGRCQYSMLPVIDPIHPVHPILAKACPSVGW